MNTPSVEQGQVAACPDCDLLYHEVELKPGQKSRCSRCGTTLRVPIADSLNKTFALSLTGLLLYIPAITMPIMTISVVGLEGKGSVIESMSVMLKTGYPFVGTMVFLVGILFPLVKLALLFWVALFLKIDRIPQYLASIFRTYKHLSEWGMVEVYMLGILVSIIKMHSMGALDFNLGFFCFFALCLVTVASSVVVDDHAFWKRFDLQEEENEPPVTITDQSALTARQAGLMRCHDCGMLVTNVGAKEDEIVRCPRCRAEIHSRKPGSISTTWALVICSIILFLPANFLPIMRVDFLGTPDISTIMDGIIYFFHEGEYFVGGIIFVASVLVPLYKIVGMMIILLSIRYGWSGWLKHKTRMFHFVEFIGRWSFLDIFVIALLAAMIQFGMLTSIGASPAARYFTAVVITTMFAAIVFDPRILWDSCANTPEIEEEHNG